MNRTNGATRRARDEAAPGAGPESGRAAGARGAVSLGSLAELIGFHLRRAQTASFQAFARRVGRTDLSPGTFALLALIEHNPGINQTMLSRADGRDKSSLTPALNGLERRGLILRQRPPGNRRTYALSLTPAGAQVLGELRLHADAHDRTLDRIVGQERKPEMIRLLRRIAGELSGDIAADEPHGGARARRRSGVGDAPKLPARNRVTHRNEREKRQTMKGRQ
jgi:DNA-binding MarR family transcriptional regulator